MNVVKKRVLRENLVRRSSKDFCVRGWSELSFTKGMEARCKPVMRLVNINSVSALVMKE